MSLVPALHLLPLVKGRNNKSCSKLPFQTARLIVYVDRTIIWFLCHHFSSVLPDGLNKQTKQTARTNNLTFSYKRNQTETIMLYCHIPYLVSSCSILYNYICLFTNSFTDRKSIFPWVSPWPLSWHIIPKHFPSCHLSYFLPLFFLVTLSASSLL